jgi:CDP-diacylglycerol pyrophosphatase
MNRTYHVTVAAIALAAVLASALVFGLATTAGPRRDALRQIVQEQCLPNSQHHDNPAPCETVFLPVQRATDNGYAILHDRKGGAHFLLIPTRTISGIESPTLLDPATPDYLAAAWNRRDVLDHWLHRQLPRDAVGLAINPRTARGQDQLHIHMECVGQSLYHVLSMNAEAIGDTWTPLTIADRQFQARRILGDDFRYANPVALLSAEVADRHRDPGDYTLIVAGRNLASGPGVVVLVGTGSPGAETLLDASCAVSPPAAHLAATSQR